MSLLFKVEKTNFYFLFAFDFFQNFSLNSFFFNISFIIKNFFVCILNSFFIAKIIKEFFRRFLRKDVDIFLNKVSKKLIKNQKNPLEINIKLLNKLNKKRKFRDIKKILVKNYSNIKLISNCFMKKISILKKLFINYHKKNNKKQMNIQRQKFRNRISCLKLLI